MVDKIRYKKYTNRRLYDTEQSKYVTLIDIARQIRNGRKVAIIDAKTKEDVTAFILTQIVLEEAKNKNILLPVTLLHLIIRYGDNVLTDFFQNHLQQTIKSYLAHKNIVDDQFRRWLEIGMDFSEASQKNMAEMNPFRAIFEQFSKQTKADDEGE